MVEHRMYGATWPPFCWIEEAGRGLGAVRAASETQRRRLYASTTVAKRTERRDPRNDRAVNKNICGSDQPNH